MKVIEMAYVLGQKKDREIKALEKDRDALIKRIEELFGENFELRARVEVMNEMTAIVNEACKFRSAIDRGESWEEIDQARRELLWAVDDFLRDVYEAE